MARGRPSSKGYTPEDIALKYCVDEGFRIGFLIGKYGEDYLRICELRQDAEEIKNMNYEANQALEKYWNEI